MLLPRCNNSLCFSGPDLYVGDDGNDDGAGPSTAADGGHDSRPTPHKEKSPQQVCSSEN